MGNELEKHINEVMELISVAFSIMRTIGDTCTPI